MIFFHFWAIYSVVFIAQQSGQTSVGKICRWFVSCCPFTHALMILVLPVASNYCLPGYFPIMWSWVGKLEPEVATACLTTFFQPQIQHLLMLEPSMFSRCSTHDTCLSDFVFGVRTILSEYLVNKLLWLFILFCCVHGAYLSRSPSWSSSWNPLKIWKVQSYITCW